MSRLLLACVVLAFVSSASAYYNVLVRARTGDIQGFTVTTQYAAKFNERINVFLGIPYAKRPSQFPNGIKDFRFRKPEPPSWYGVWDATKYKPACPQEHWLARETIPNFSEMDEDCLYLNIFAPNKTDEHPAANPPLYPVLVFIHGGGWNMGTAQQYPGLFLAERNIVVVTLNYRLNALGFLSTGDHYSPGNYGLWDQLRALEFVKENIRYFRGNPDLVTIAGQSTGAASVGIHLVSPRSDNLFQRAIMMSGSDLSSWAVVPEADAQDYAKALASRVGCPYGDSQRLIDCLRDSRSASEIVNASARVPMKPGKVGSPWGPVMDGNVVGVDYAFLPDPPEKIRRQGRHKRIVTMIGMVEDEGSFFIPNLPNLIDGVTEAQFKNIIREFLLYRNAHSLSVTSEALQFEYTYWPLPGNYSFIRQSLIDMMSDFIVGKGMSDALTSHAMFNKTYAYVFGYRSWNDYLPPFRGVAHGQDLQYVFGFPFFNETYTNMTGLVPRQEYDYPDRNISEYMISMWTNFTARGDPTPRDRPIKEFRNATWLEYNLSNHSYLSITNMSLNLTNFRQRNYAFWREYFPKITGVDYTVQSSPIVQGNPAYEIATYCLTAVCGLLIIIVIALCIVNVRKTSTKDYDDRYSSKSATLKTRSSYC